MYADVGGYIERIFPVGCEKMAVGNELTVVPKVAVRVTVIGFASSSIM
jgi:hypothetical protein